MFKEREHDTVQLKPDPTVNIDFKNIIALTTDKIKHYINSHGENGEFHQSQTISDIIYLF